MSEEAYKQQQELANMIKRYSRQDGVHPAAIPSLFLILEDCFRTKKFVKR